LKEESHKQLYERLVSEGSQGEAEIAIEQGKISGPAIQAPGHNARDRCVIM